MTVNSIISNLHTEANLILEHFKDQVVHLNFRWEPSIFETMIPTPGIDKIRPESTESIFVDLRRFRVWGDLEEKNTVLQGISNAMMRGVVAESDD